MMYYLATFNLSQRSAEIRERVEGEMRRLKMRSIGHHTRSSWGFCEMLKLKSQSESGMRTRAQSSNGLYVPRVEAKQSGACQSFAHQ